MVVLNEEKSNVRLNIMTLVRVHQYSYTQEEKTLASNQLFEYLRETRDVWHNFPHFPRTVLRKSKELARRHPEFRQKNYSQNLGFTCSVTTTRGLPCKNSTPHNHPNKIVYHMCSYHETLDNKIHEIAKHGAQELILAHNVPMVVANIACEYLVGGG